MTIYLQRVDVLKPVLQAEIRPGMFKGIDGNHRIELAYRQDLEYVQSHKRKGEQLLHYFADICGYRAFVEYWNSKL